MRAMLAGLVMLLPGMLVAQGGYDLTFVARKDGRDVGRERVVLRAGQAGDRSRLELESRYAGSPETRAVLVRGDRGVFESLQLETKQQAGNQNLQVTSQGSRIFITTSAQGMRGGRELPGGPGVVMVDERMAGLLVAAAELATPEGTRLLGVSPRTAARTPFTATRQGNQVVLSGGMTGRIELDADGRMERVELDGGVTLVRAM
jgi:hypothetical protein